ncbi:MAG: SH3 domain-containing protein [Ardenticatenaceae bacterium]|nr:SH3 domain-containing protein [Ardenticatenaceae bacterium]
MSENDPQEVARQALGNQPDNGDNPGGSGGNNGNGSNPLPIVIGVGILAVILIGAGLYMLFGNNPTDTTAVPEDGEAVQADSLAGDAADEEVAVVSTADLAALPGDLSPKGDIAILVDGNAVSVSGGVQAADDLYLWNGSEWVFVPSQVSPDGQQLILDGQPSGQEVLVVERPAPQTVAVGAEVSSEEGLPVDLLPYLNEVSVNGYLLGDNGQLEATPITMPSGGYQQYLYVTNAGVIVNQTGLSAILADEAAINAHVQELATAVQSGGYTGLHLDYQGAIAGQMANYTALIEQLASALDAQGSNLAVTLATPADNNGQWDTGGQDWSAVGTAADIVVVQMPLDPTAYIEGGQAELLLSWAARQVDRSKLTALFSANAIDKLGAGFRELPVADALAKVGDLEVADGETAVDPGTAVEFTLAGDATPLEWDGESLTYKYSYEEEGQMRTVWLNSDASLANRLRLADLYRLRGVMVRGLDGISNPTGYAAAVESYTAGGDIPQPAGAAITWSVENEEGGVVASASGEALNFVWEGTEANGVYTVKAGFAQGDLTVDLSSAEITVGDGMVADEAAEEVAVDEEGEGEEVASEESEEEAAAEETTAEVVISGSANAEVLQPSNVRNGPGLVYGIVDGLNPGSQVEVVGRSNDNLWYNISYPDGKEGWVYGQLVQVDSSVDIASLPVPAVTASPVAQAPATSGGGGESSGQQAPAAPAAPAPVAPANLGGGFELGGQLLGGAYAQASYSGMTWVKRQHKWSAGNTGQEVAGMISEAHNAGFKILLSVPGQLYPTSLPDFNAYTEFMRAVASLPDPPDAIEIFNEMNIEVEWPNGQIDPAMYTTQMLAPAYNAIKSVNPNILVISGAPAPTGFFQGGCSAAGCDDDAYMRGMAAAGAANYMDCIGVHYNEGIIPPSQRSGDPRGNSSHYTRYFWGMLDTYYNAFGGSRPICFTELGYLTPEGYGGLSSGFSWAANTTVAQQSQWLAEAVSLSANSGKVRMLIVWNVDSTTFGTDPQAGFAIIRPDGSCPACETLRQVMGN